MNAVIFVSICFGLVARKISGQVGDNIDVYKKLLDLEARLEQKDVENLQNKEVIARLERQLDSVMNVNRNKRFVVEMDTEAEIVALKTRLDQKEKEIADLKKQQGSTYTRWGRTTCPSNGTDLLYSGFMAGTYHVGTDKGAGANYLCISDHPTWDHYSETVNNAILVTGVEYNFFLHNTNHAHDISNFFGSDISYAEAPCAVCRTQLNTNVMIPGRTDCYPGWTKEYSGYLVGAYPGYDDASEYVCLDRRPETVLNSGRADNTNMLFFVETRCDSSLECPPYSNNRELACVVCSL